jgi:hypothetical protein
MASYSLGKTMQRWVRMVEFRGPLYFAIDLADMNHPFLFNLYDIVSGRD